MSKLVIGRNPQLRNTNNDLIFINDWCGIREFTNEKLDYNHKVADIPVELPIEILEIITKSRMFEDSIFPRLCDELNSYHQVNRDSNFWKILIGAWLRRVIEMFFFRKHHIIRCVEKYQIDTISVLCNTNLVQPTFLTSDFLHLRYNEEWDAQITSKIVQSLDLPGVVLEQIQSSNNSEMQNQQSLLEDSQFEGKEKPERLLKRFLRRFQRGNDAFICRTYLNRSREVLLSLSFAQAPQFYEFKELTRPLNSGEFNRLEMFSNLSRNFTLTDERFLVSMITDLFPSCYLENLPELERAVSLAGFPAKPKFIFTSNEFDTNEIFKLWSASQVEDGTPYFIGQHGNNYGVNRYFSPYIEEIVCDAFLTWGWSRDSLREIPCFNFKQPKRKRRKKKGSSLVLFELPFENDNLSWSGIRQFENYMAEQFCFVENLSETVRKELVVRLYQPKAFPAGQDISRWCEFDARIKIDSESSSNSLIAQAKMAVFSYDSTGILERLSLNLPVMAFWENRFMHVSEEFVALYEELASVGILHPSAISASSFIDQHWNNIDEWWFSDSVQLAVSKFCRILARNSNFPVFELSKTLRGLLTK